MSDLTGQLISNTYKQVILVSSSTSNTGVNTSLKAVQTGDGTNTALKVATNAVQITGALGVTGNVSLDANLHVDDKVCASAFYGDGSNLSGVTASVGGNISVSNATVGGNLYVGGTATVAGATHLQSTVSVGGAAQFGSTVTVSGAAQLQSTVTAVGAATFKSTVTVENAAILKNNVSVGGTFAVAGAATFTSKTEFDNDVSVSGRLDVASSVCVGGIAKFASDVSVSGNLNVVNNVTAAFFYGDGSNLTNVEAELGVATNISVSGFIHAGGSVSVSGPFNVVGAATFKSNVSVSGNSNFTGTVTVGGAVSLASSLSVGGAANFASTVTVAGAVSLASTLSVGGATNLGSTVTVVGAGTFKDAVSVSGNLNIGGTVTVGGAVSLASSLSVGGAANFASTVTVAGAVSLASTLSVGGAANFASTVTIAGTNLQATNARVCASAYYGDGSNLTNVPISGNISVNNATVGGNLHVGGTVTAVGAAIFNSTVTVSGNATFKTNVSVSGNTNLGGTVTVAGAASLASTLSVGGAANFASTVTIAGVVSLGDELHVSGDVGIGTASPTQALEVDGAIVAGGAAGTFSADGIHLQNKGSGIFDVGAWRSGANASILTFSTDSGSDSSPVEHMRIEGGGDVGIGTTNPSQKLTVNGTDARIYLTGADTDIDMTGTADGQLSLDGNGYAFGIALNSSGANLYTNTASRDLIFGVNETEIMRITDGNVGIGVTAPQRLLSVGANQWGLDYSSNLLSLTQDNTSSGVISIGGIGTTKIVSDTNNNGTGDVVFETGAEERMRIDSSGNVGIGVTSPSEKVQITAGANSALLLGYSDGVGVGYRIRSNVTTSVDGGFLIEYNDGTDLYRVDHDGGSGFHAWYMGGSEAMRINSSGNVGIGTSSPAKQLHITKAAKADIGTLTDGATITPNFDSNQNFSVTLGGNRTLANPSNIDAGQTGSIFVVQDGTGSRTLSFGSYWKFAGGTAPTLSTAAGSVDRIDYIVYTTTAIHAVATLNVS